MRWRAFYDDDRVFNSEDTEWKDLPYDGVQLVTVYLPQGERHISGQDYYFKAGDVIGGNSDPPSTTRKRYPGVSIKRGRWTSDERMAEIKRRARE